MKKVYFALNLIKIAIAKKINNTPITIKAIFIRLAIVEVLELCEFVETLLTVDDVFEDEVFCFDVLDELLLELVVFDEVFEDTSFCELLLLLELSVFPAVEDAELLSAVV